MRGTPSCQSTNILKYVTSTALKIYTLIITVGKHLLEHQLVVRCVLDAQFNYFVHFNASEFYSTELKSQFP